jgi:hypothetical protein
MTGSDFGAWMKRHGLTVRSAAAALGCSPLTIQRYRKPDAKIPLYFELACRYIAHRHYVDHCHATGLVLLLPPPKGEERQ